MAKFIEDRLVQEGVKVILNQGAERILDQGRTIQLEDGTKLASELIILSVGVRPQLGACQGCWNRTRYPWRD